jgi:hypothetical protein
VGAIPAAAPQSTPPRRDGRVAHHQGDRLWTPAEPCPICISTLGYMDAFFLRACQNSTKPSPRRFPPCQQKGQPGRRVAGFLHHRSPEYSGRTSRPALGHGESSWLNTAGRNSRTRRRYHGHKAWVLSSTGYIDERAKGSCWGGEDIRQSALLMKVLPPLKTIGQGMLFDRMAWLSRHPHRLISKTQADACSSRTRRAPPCRC